MGLQWGNNFYMCSYRENISKIFFSITTGPEKLKLHESYLTKYKSKFVKIMAPGGRVGPKWWKLFLHVFI
jgi:hypothetical protein